MGVLADVYVAPREGRLLPLERWSELAYELLSRALVEPEYCLLAGEVSPLPSGVVNVSRSIEPATESVQIVGRGSLPSDLKSLLGHTTLASHESIALWFSGLNAEHPRIREWLEARGFANGDLVLYRHEDRREFWFDSFEVRDEDFPSRGHVPPTEEQMDLLEALAAGDESALDEFEELESEEGVTIHLQQYMAITGKGTPDSICTCEVLHEILGEHMGFPLHEYLFMS